jgi:hypothetical protein
MKPANTVAYALHGLSEIFAKGQAWCDSFDGTPSTSGLMHFLAEETQEFLKNPVFAVSECPSHSPVNRTFPLLDEEFLKILRMYVPFDAVVKDGVNKLRVSIVDDTGTMPAQTLEIVMEVERSENMGTTIRNWDMRRRLIDREIRPYSYRELTERQIEKFTVELKNLFFPHMR